MSTHRALLLLSLSLLLGCSEQPPAHGCSSDAQCAVGSRCTKSVCTGDTRPTASIKDVGAVEEFALVTLDGSGSTYAEGKLFQHRWSVRSIDAPCGPPEVAGNTSIARVRFGCAGRYEVSLTVVDDLQMPSDPARQEVTVRASTATSIVATGADVGVDHRCGGTPFSCRPTSRVQLTAQAAPNVTLRWTVQPPAERPLDATRRVSFSPSPDVRSPVVDIVTDGTAISGDWIFRAEVVDRYGVVGAAATRVSIRNRPPVVTFTPAGPFDHVFAAQESVFRSEGAVAWDVVDPDGDPVEVFGVWRHVGDGDASVFDGDFAGSTVTFAVEVPYATREDAAKLRGGDGLLRQIELTAVDANRTTGLVEIPIVIGNRPPIPDGGMVEARVPHTFDAARSMYVAYFHAGTFVDPDGDPLVDSTGPGLCQTFHPHGNDVDAECTVPFVGVPALDRLAGTHAIPVAPHDPWDAAAVITYRTIEILNSPPEFSPVTSPGTKCVADKLIFRIGEVNHNYFESPIGFGVAPHAFDPDGDPVVLIPRTADGGTVSPASVVCTGAQCIPFSFYEPADSHTQAQVVLKMTDHSSLSASDGVARVEKDVSPAWDVKPVGSDSQIPAVCPDLDPYF